MIEGYYSDEAFHGDAEEQTTESAWTQVERELHGGKDHQIEIRRRVLNSGKVQYWEQCTICGRAPHAVSSRDHRLLRLVTVNAFDDTLRNTFSTKLFEEVSRRNQSTRQATAERINQEWWDNYNHYRQTPQWMARSQHVLERDKYVCQACLRRPATQAHHLTYKHAFDEPLFDLIAVCKPCHDRITTMDRKRRGEL